MLDVYEYDGSIILKMHISTLNYQMFISEFHNYQTLVSCFKGCDILLYLCYHLNCPQCSCPQGSSPQGYLSQG